MVERNMQPDEPGRPPKVVDTIARPDGGLIAVHEHADGTTTLLDLGPRQSASNRKEES